MKYVFKKKSKRIAAGMMDSVGHVLFAYRRLLKKTFPQDPKKILVVRLDHIGDFVTTTPLLETLKKNYPGSKLTVLVSPAVASLAQRDPFVDEVIDFAAPWFSRDTEKKAGVNEMVRRLRDEKFDVAIDPRGDFFTISMLFRARVGYCVGYGITGGGYLLHTEVPYNRDDHVVRRNLRIAQALGLVLDSTKPRVYYHRSDVDYVEQLLRSAGMRCEKAIVMHACAGTRAKQWPKKYFAQTIKQLYQQGYKIFMVGGNDEKTAYDTIYDLRGALTLPQLAALLRKVDFFIGLDSGPANIAAALGVPSIVICSGTNIPQQWLPLNEKETLLYHNVECKPCEQTQCPKEQHYCMEGVSVARVLEAAAQRSRGGV